MFATKLMGTTEHLRVSDVEGQLRGVIATAMATALGGGEIAFLDMAANQQALSDRLKDAVDAAFKQWGLACPSFFVESVSLPEEVQAYLDKASSMRVVGDLDRYAKFQAADAIEAAASNQGGLGGIGASAAAGMAIGQQMAGALGGGGGGGAPGEDAFAQIEKLHKLMTLGAISQAEFDAKKAELLSRIR